MNHYDEVNAKMQAEKAYTQTPNLAGDTCGVQAGRPYTNREQAEKNVGYHRMEADKHDRAAAFFRENPAFDEFIQLVRSGAIQF